LIGFWIVRIEVILAVKVHLLVNIHVQGQSSLDTIVNDPLVHNRQNTWEGPVDDIGVGIRIFTEVSWSW